MHTDFVASALLRNKVDRAKGNSECITTIFTVFCSLSEAIPEPREARGSDNQLVNSRLLTI